jgi:hypothetical protein
MVSRLRKKRLLTTDKDFIEDIDCCIFTVLQVNALDYYILLDSFYNIKISRMFYVPLWICG